MSHEPVLNEQVVALLVSRPGGIYLDGTVGMGGHAARVLKAAGESAQLVALDKDPEALHEAEASLQRFKRQVIFKQAGFEEMGRVLDELKIAQVDGVLLDCGVSSMQLDRPERGFSFRNDGPLNMQFDPSGNLPASELVNRENESSLADILFKYGQERYAKRIARQIARSRPINGTAQLSRCVEQAMGPAARRGKIHPATRTFQALRIAVNSELGALEAAVPQAIERLVPKGRVVVLAYHSLEDRIVKQTFREQAKQGKLEILTKRPMRPEETEVSANPRARSARLRAGERIG